MNGFSVYKIHVALKAHFTTEKFCVFDNQGRTRVNFESYLKRRDSECFEKISNKLLKERAVVDFFVANYAFGNDDFIWDFQKGIDSLTKWYSVKDAFSRYLKGDLDKIVSEVRRRKVDKKSIFHFTSSGNPVILDLWLAGQILPHTMVILNKSVGLYEPWLSSPMGIVIKDKLLMLNKLTKFVKGDEVKIQELLYDFVEELKEITNNK
jgi:hypothetical protein